MKKSKEYKELINTSNSFYIDKEVLIIANYEGLFIINNNEKKIVCDTKVYSFKYFQKILFYQKENGKEVFIFNNLFQKVIEGHFFLSSSIISNDFLLIRSKKNDSKIINLFNHSILDFENIDLLFFPVEIFNNSYFSNVSGGIQKYDLSNNLLWKVDFKSTITEIQIWNHEIVFVELIGDSVNQIIAIDALNGAVLWQKEGGALQVKKDVLYYLRYNQTTQVLIEFNLRQNIEAQYDITKIIIDQFEFTDIPFFFFLVKNSYLYLTFTNEKTIIIVNLKKLITEWVYKIETSAWQIDKPQVQDDKLYVIDSDRVLHVFEKE